MKNILLIINILILGLGSVAKGTEDHDHKEKEIKNEHDHKDGDKHKEEKKSGHDHGKKHEDEENEGGKNVGPNKGVTSIDEENGFTLSDEARKKFSIETEMVTGSGPWNFPESALLLTGEEKNIYRFRNGYFKRIDIQIFEKNGSQVYLNSPELKNGDSVVVKGVGFIRTAELDVTSGESGHHH
jgi:hypothetical protein